jgi:hypothetical protein
VLHCPVSATTFNVPGLLNFIEKIIHRGRLSVHVVIISLIYIKRAKENLPRGARGQESTAHRLFLVSVLLASKYLSDTPSITAHRLSELCGRSWSGEEIIKMEQAFLRLIDFRLWVSDKNIHSFVKEYGTTSHS